MVIFCFLLFFVFFSLSERKSHSQKYELITGMLSYGSIVSHWYEARYEWVHEHVCAYVCVHISHMIEVTDLFLLNDVCFFPWIEHAHSRISDIKTDPL